MDVRQKYRSEAQIGLKSGTFLTTVAGPSFKENAVLR
jgi:hypothetical protein